LTSFTTTLTDGSWVNIAAPTSEELSGDLSPAIEFGNISNIKGLNNIDVVFTVHWDCLGSEVVSGSTYNGRVYGATGVTYHSCSTFTPYNQLQCCTISSVNRGSIVNIRIFDSLGNEVKYLVKRAVKK
jgi:hypothetical protein